MKSIQPKLDSAKVSEKPRPIGVDLFAGFQEIKRGSSVTGKVLEGRLREVAGGLADAAIIEPERRKAVAREVVRDDEKRLVLEDCLIAIRRCR